jgi:hypothetical protein
MVMVLAFHEADNPAGNPVAVPMPVAPVVAMVIGVIAEPEQTTGLADGLPAELIPFTVTTVAEEVAVQPPPSANVTVYDPPVVTTIDCVVAPVDQVLPVAEEEVSVTEPP